MRWFAILAVLVFVACGGGDDDDDADDANGETTQVSSGNATASASEPTEDSSEPTQDTSGGLPDVHVPLEVGSTGEVQSSNPDPMDPELDIMSTVKVTIVAFIDPAEAANEMFQPEAGNRFWAVEMTMENTGDKPVNTGIWTLRTTDGNEYETVVLLGIVHDGASDDLTYGAIEPGATEAGVQVFQIPEDATVESLHMSPSIFVGGNLIFDAP